MGRFKDIADAYKALRSLTTDSNQNVRNATNRALAKLRKQTPDIQALINQALVGPTEQERLQAIRDIYDYLADSGSNFS